MHASSQGHTTVVQALVEAKADLNLQGQVSCKCLSFVAIHQFDILCFLSKRNNCVLSVHIGKFYGTHACSHKRLHDHRAGADWGEGSPQHERIGKSAEFARVYLV